MRSRAFGYLSTLFAQVQFVFVTPSVLSPVGLILRKTNGERGVVVMRYLIREFVFFFVMLHHRIRSRHLRVEFRAKADKNSTFEGFNRLSHHSYFSGDMGYASYIGANSVVIGKIGRFCSIAENVHFLTLTHPIHSFVSTHPCFYSLKKQSGFTFASDQLFDEEPRYEEEKHSIIVGNDVYIGFGATIIGPCKIGDGAVIAAGAIVTKDVDPYDIVGGVPAKRIRSRFSNEDISRLLVFKWWEKDIEWIKQHSSDFCSADIILKNMKEEPYE